MSFAAHRSRAADSPDGERIARFDELLLKIVDGGLAGCVFVVPLLMGGRQALGQLALVVLAVVVTLAWLLRLCLRPTGRWRTSSVEILLLAGVVLLLVQMVPLPDSLLAHLAPNTSKVLPLWNASTDGPGALGSWSYVSLTPSETRAALVIFLAYTLLFLVTLQRIHSVDDVERLLRWIAMSALLMGGFGLIQLITSNGKFFWFYEHPFSTTSKVATGSFTNRNHFAQFLALGIGPLIWWMQHRSRKERKRRKQPGQWIHKGFDAHSQLSGLKVVALGVVLFAALLSLSRGGAVALFVAAAVCVGVCFRAKTLGVRFVLSIAAVGLMTGLLLTVHGYDQVTGRLDELNTTDLDTLDSNAGRRTVWAANLDAIPSHALIGSGVGSHRFVVPMYIEQPMGKEATHAECSPLQVLLETGLVGLALVLIGIGFCAAWCFRSLWAADSKRMLVCAGAISAALAANLVHAFVDFIWYVPGCMAIVVLLAAAACRLHQINAERAGKPVPVKSAPRLVAVAAAVLVVVLGGWMFGNRWGPTLAEPHWDRYQNMELAATGPAGQQNRQPGQTDDDDQPVSADPDTGSAEMLSRMIFELEKVVENDPDHARARLRLAGVYLQRFELEQQTAENAMPLSQVRDAANRARATSSAEEVDAWLSRALGERRADLDKALGHVRRALQLSPMQGEGYLYLASLLFLEGADSEPLQQAHLAQALRVRPCSGDVLIEVGREAVLAGDLEAGIGFWQRAFRCSRVHQRQLIELLAGRLPVQMIIAAFQPDLSALRMLHANLRVLEQPEAAGVLGQLYAQAQFYGQARRDDGHPVDPNDAAMAWLQGQLAELRCQYADKIQEAIAEAEGREAGKLWLEASWIYKLTHRYEDSLAAAKQAFQIDGNNYDIRFALALAHANMDQYAEAERHFKWCLIRRPNNLHLQQLMRQAFKRKIDSQGTDALKALLPSPGGSQPLMRTATSADNKPPQTHLKQGTPY